MNQALAGQRGEAHISRIEWEDIGTGRGFVSATARLRLTVEGPENLPETMIAKFSCKGVEGDYYRKIGHYQRELIFYRELRRTCPVETPRCYYAGRDGDTYLLLLEDLAGCEVADEIEGTTIERVEQVLLELARLHAFYWQHAILDDIDWPEIELEVADVRRKTQEGFQHLETHFGDRPLTRMATSMEAPLRKYLQLVERARALGLGRVKKGRLERRGKGTLVHGDPRLDNIFFRNTRPIMVDWQSAVAGDCARDVAHFLIWGLTVEQRRDHEARLTRFYYDALCEGGVRGYSFRQLQVGYARGVFAEMMSIASIAKQIGCENARSEKLARTIFDRVEQACLDHRISSRLKMMALVFRARGLLIRLKILFLGRKTAPTRARDTIP